VHRNLWILLFVTLVWGTTFPLLKTASATLSGVEISGIRFVIAALCMSPFLRQVPRRTWMDGALLGALALVSYVAQAYGMQFISSNRSAFLTSLAVLLVPMLGSLFWGSRLSGITLVAAVMAFFGIGLMSWDGGANLVGDAATLLCALFYALYVLVLSQRSGSHNARQLTATQILFMAVFSSLWIGANGVGNDALSTLGARFLHNWQVLVYLGLVATAGMLLLQAIGQRGVSADKAAVIYAMEPVFATLFGWLWINEVLSARAALGGAIVVVAVILSELKPLQPNKMV
jgi:drug/metabolite transporter (DMT)-like permease